MSRSKPPFVSKAPASASSAELTGCLNQRGQLTNVASGVRPLGGACGSRGERVSIPVISGGAGRPGTARVDSYSFFAEVSTADGQSPLGGAAVRKTLFEINIGQNLLVGIEGVCVEYNGRNIAHFEGESDILTVPAEFFFFEASISQERPEFDHADLAADVQVAHFIDSHIRVKIEAAATVDRGSPALCTFSGTVDVIRAR